MERIENNSFRKLGIPVNASTKELTANMAKRRLFDISQQPSFPDDMSSWMPKLSRSKEGMDAAFADIHLDANKVESALFWFARPSDEKGKQGYELLLRGDTEAAKACFEQSQSWESLLCLSTMQLELGDVKGAACNMSALIDSYGEEFLSIVVGKAHAIKIPALYNNYVEGLSEQHKLYNLYSQLSNSEVPDGLLEELKQQVKEKSVATIDNEVALTEKIEEKLALVWLKAGELLRDRTQQPLDNLKHLLGKTDKLYVYKADKVAEQILQCAISCHNIVLDEQNAEGKSLLETCVGLCEYAQRLSIEKSIQEKIAQQMSVIRKNWEEYPSDMSVPEGVEKEEQAIRQAMSEASNVQDETTDTVRTLLDAVRPYLQTMRSQLGADNPFYLNLSTQVVETALNIIIRLVNPHISLCNSMVNIYEACVELQETRLLKLFFRKKLQNMCSELSINLSVVNMEVKEIMELMEMLKADFEVNEQYRETRFLPLRYNILRLKEEADRLSEEISYWASPIQIDKVLEPTSQHWLRLAIIIVSAAAVLFFFWAIS